jgi:hypothetical protein
MRRPRPPRGCRAIGWKKLSAQIRSWWVQTSFNLSWFTCALLMAQLHKRQDNSWSVSTLSCGLEFVCHWIWKHKFFPWFQMFRTLLLKIKLFWNMSSYFLVIRYPKFLRLTWRWGQLVKNIANKLPLNMASYPKRLWIWFYKFGNLIATQISINTQSGITLLRILVRYPRSHINIRVYEGKKIKIFPKRRLSSTKLHGIYVNG